MGCNQSGAASGSELERRLEGSDDDDDDNVDDIVARPRNRKMSVSAETYSDQQMAKQLKKIGRSAPKSAVAKAKIIKMCQASSIFSHLGHEELEALAGAFFAKQHKAGEVIIREGEKNGDNVYIIDEGEVTVFVESAEGTRVEWSSQPQKQAATCKEGHIFGELAIMYNAPRAASCIATKASKTWALDRTHFALIVRESTQKRLAEHQGFVSKVPILADLTKYERLTIADDLREERFKQGEVVLRQGEEGNTFFIIKQGLAVCTRQDQSSGSKKENVVARLGEGAHFGEIALLTPKPRQATVTAHSGELVVLTMDRATFNRVMGPLKDILNRHIGGYESYLENQALDKSVV